MSRVHDKDVDRAADPKAQEPVGRVEMDSRGHNVWRWAKDVIESTSVLLKRLENKDLALEPTQKVPVVRTANSTPKAPKAAAKPESPKKAARHAPLQPDRRSGAGGGFDPYNTR